MDSINLFGKNFKYKNYDCSCDKYSFPKRKPIFNLYLQITDICNAHCNFCDKADCLPLDKEFDHEKFTYILKMLFSRGIVGGISITGGEPLLDIEKLDGILRTIYTVNKNAHVSINTNGSKMDNFSKLKFFNKIAEIHVSRHSHNDKENQDVFNIPVASLKEIQQFAGVNPSLKTILNCVLQNKLIDTSDKIKEYLETISDKGNINEVRFITLLPITEECSKLKVDVKNIITNLKEYTNAGCMFDKNICECFSFMYISSQGVPVTAFIRNTKELKALI